VISENARWIAWLRPASAVTSMNPPLVMEVVDTATGRARWSRNADADARSIGALAVTNDGVVVFAHCLKPSLDDDGRQQCGDARVDAWAPDINVVRSLPAGVSVGDVPFPGIAPTLTPLVRRIGAHNGLLIQRAETARPQYVRVSSRGDVDVVATLPRDTEAVTADERFALVVASCPSGGGSLVCGGVTILRLDGGSQRPLPSLDDFIDPRTAGYYKIAVERDDLLVIIEPSTVDGFLGPGGPAVARCSLSQARCVPIEK
jgi:hypothetical protein